MPPQPFEAVGTIWGGHLTARHVAAQGCWFHPEQRGRVGGVEPCLVVAVPHGSPQYNTLGLMAEEREIHSPRRG